MSRTASEIEAEIEAMRASGADMRTKKAQDLRAELKEANASAPSTPASSVAAEPVRASGDVAFINDALAKLVLEGKAGKPERCYSDLRSALHVKHILEDAAGLVAAGRISLPHWDTLGRDRDSGEKFNAKTLAIAKETGASPQVVADGLVQRAMPMPKAAEPTKARVEITDAVGNPIRLPRTRLDEPEGVAVFVGGSDSAE